MNGGEASERSEEGLVIGEWVRNENVEVDLESREYRSHYIQAHVMV